jgi:hypothetical protein
MKPRFKSPLPYTELCIRVTRSVFKEIAQNVAQPIFLSKFILRLIHGIK